MNRLILLLTFCFVFSGFYASGCNDNYKKKDSTYITAINVKKAFSNGIYLGDFKDGKFTGNISMKYKNGISVKGGSIGNAYGEHALTSARICIPNTGIVKARVATFHKDNNLYAAFPFPAKLQDIEDENKSIEIEFVNGDVYKGMYAIEPFFEYFKGEYFFQNGISLKIADKVKEVVLANGDKVSGEFAGMNRVKQCEYKWAKRDLFIANYGLNGMREGDIVFKFYNGDTFKAKYENMVMKSGVYKPRGARKKVVDITNADFLDRKDIPVGNLYRIGLVKYEDCYKLGDNTAAKLYSKLKAIKDDKKFDSYSVEEDIRSVMYEMQPNTIIYPMPEMNLKLLYYNLNNAYASYSALGLNRLSLCHIYKASKCLLSLMPNYFKDSQLVSILPRIKQLCDANYNGLVADINSGKATKEVMEINNLFKQLDYKKYSVELYSSKYLENDHKWLYRCTVLPEKKGLVTQPYAAYLSEKLSLAEKKKFCAKNEHFKLLGNIVVPERWTFIPKYKEYKALIYWMTGDVPSRKERRDLKKYKEEFKGFHDKGSL